ncbi:MAG: hypothetical protein GF393_06600, partial [Armatimonadia bacterium]|nr:hypothetical protein [Armatimonadia bacterium]
MRSPRPNRRHKPDLAPGVIGISRRPLTLRAILLGLACAAAACWMISWAEMTIGSIQFGILQFSPLAIGLLLAVVLANLVVGRLAPRLALRPHEVIIIYTM